jgi:hypothetical protein
MKDKIINKNRIGDIETEKLKILKMFHKCST